MESHEDTVRSELGIKMMCQWVNGECVTVDGVRGTLCPECVREMCPVPSVYVLGIIDTQCGVAVSTFIF